MNKYIRDFLKEEDGAETIEWIALIAVAAALIGIITAISTKMKDSGAQADTAISDALAGLTGSS